MSILKENGFGKIPLKLMRIAGKGCGCTGRRPIPDGTGVGYGYGVQVWCKVFCNQWCLPVLVNHT